MKKIKLFLADDHAIMREGLGYILSGIPGYEIVGESGDGREAYEMIERTKPDVAILDISMPSMTGIEVARRLLKYCPGVKIIMLSRHDNEEYVRELLDHGVHGYVLKDSAGDDLLRAISEVLRGNVYLSPRLIAGVLPGRAGTPPRRADADAPGVILSNREREILKLIAEGKSGAQIASTLFLSENTVKVHRANIMKKLDIHKSVDLAKYAIKYGLVEE
ncbi:MAG: response regulator transcription factor [Spirochaetes bacterium]|nr:MAG: response regulator transcription factor [Spirochaetota bacterium]